MLDGIAVFMCNATDDPARERRHLDQLLGKRIDGLVVTARRSDKRPSVESQCRCGLPMVIYVYRRRPTTPNVAWPWCLDDEGGARLATEHLIGRGRRRIAHLTGPAHFEAVTLRHRGYAGALAEAGLPQLPGFFRNGKWSEASGAMRWRELVRRRTGSSRMRCSAAMT